LLDPSFDIIFDNQEMMSIPENYPALRSLFESIEPGSCLQLDKFMEEAEQKYDLGMRAFSYMPGLSVAEFADIRLIHRAFRLNLFSSFSSYVRKYFTHPKLIALMEFPVLFLGTMPRDTPALYSLMNYAGLKLGTWYPLGGFGQAIRSMQELASRNEVEFFFNAPVEKILIKNNQATGIRVDGTHLPFDALPVRRRYSASKIGSQLPGSLLAEKNLCTFMPDLFSWCIQKNTKTKSPHVIFRRGPDATCEGNLQVTPVYLTHRTYNILNPRTEGIQSRAQKPSR